MNVSPSIGAGCRIEVLKPGVSTTVQDLGRTGFQHFGVPGGGAMDRTALRIANLLVGNSEHAAALETTMAGPVLRFDVDAIVAVGGARFAGVKSWQTLFLKAGETLSLTHLEAGCRGYMAVAGGIAVKPVMGSASTFTRAKLGGLAGRMLRAGDVLETGSVLFHHAIAIEHWHISPAMLPAYVAEPTVRVIQGPQWPLFSEDAQRALFGEAFAVSPKSDRMGLRLIGSALTLREPHEIMSEAVGFGSIQVLPMGSRLCSWRTGRRLAGIQKSGT